MKYFLKDLVYSSNNMRLSTVISGSLLTYKSLVFGRPQNMRRDIGGLDGDSFLSEDVNEMIDPYDELSIVIPSLEDLPPKDPYVISMDQGSVNAFKTGTPFTATDIAPSIDSTAKTSPGESLITDVVRQSFLSIKNRRCQYGLYSFSANKRQLVFKQCGKGSEWKDLSDSISNSEPGFVLSPLREGGILSIRNLYNEDSSEDAIAIAINEAAWLDALKPDFGHVIAIGRVFDSTSLAALMNQYYAPKFPSPASWFQFSP